MSPVTERFVLTRELSGYPPELPNAVTLPAIGGIARFGHTRAGDLCFCDREPGSEYGEVAVGTVLLCVESLADSLSRHYPGVLCIPAADPRALFIDLGHRFLDEQAVAVSDAIPRPFGIHPDTRIGTNCDIHPETRIDAGARIGAQCVIHRGSWIQAGAVIRDQVTIGVPGINAYRGLDGRVRNFPHFASAIIGPGTEIGAGSVVVRGILNSTRIGAGCVVGNLCNVGHGAELGDRVWMSVGTLVGGHTRIHEGATLGMGVAVKDNITIGERAQIGMGSVVVKSVKAGASMFGNPARPVGPIQAGPGR